MRQIKTNRTLNCPERPDADLTLQGDLPVNTPLSRSRLSSHKTSNIRNKVALSLLLLVIGSLFTSGFAQENVDRDDSRNAHAQVEGLQFGQVDPRTGALSLLIPLGMSYPQKGGGSFGLTLQYSSYINLYTNNPLTRSEIINSPGQGPNVLFDHRLVRFKWKDGQAHAGLGWFINTGFGHLVVHNGGSIQNNSNKATFTTPDGREIYFYDRFKEGQTRAPNTWFSRGGEYARLTYDDVNDLFEVELADGYTHVFEKVDGRYQPTKVQERFNPNNAMTLVRSETNENGTFVPVWTITDTEGRVFELIFGESFMPYGDATTEHDPTIHPIFLQAPTYHVVTRVNVPAINGTTATFDLNYVTQTGFKPFHESISLTPLYYSEYTALQLESLITPSSEQYSFTYNNNPAESEHLGAIATLTHANGGLVAWTYDKTQDPDNEGQFGWFDPHMKVASQEMYDREGATISDKTLLAKTEYLYQVMDETGIMDIETAKMNVHPQTYDRATVVRDFTSATAYDDTIHYYNLRNYSEEVDKERHEVICSGGGHVRITGESRFYQLPGTLHQVRTFYPPTPQAGCAGIDVFLSVRHFEGDYINDQPIRSTYVRYQADVALKEGGNTRIGHRQLVNSRVFAQIVFDHDDDSQTVTYQTDWTGYGQFRTQVVTREFENDWTDLSAVPTRTVYRHLVPFEESGSPHPASLGWVLNVPEFMTTKDSGSEQVVRQDFDIDTSNGFLRRTRAYHNLDETLHANDVITEFVPNSNGRAAEIKVYGGALQALTTDINTPLTAVNLVPLKPETHRRMTYLHGSEKTVEILDPDNGSLYLVQHDRAIDANTGLVTRDTGPDGVRMRYDYDSSGRIIWELPEDGAGMTTEYQSASPSQAGVIRRFNRLNGNIIYETDTTVDGWGRKIKERTRFPGANAWSVRQWDYGQKPDGYLNRMSTAYMQGSGTATWITMTYDALGRQIQTAAPDGTHTDFTFLGRRQLIQTHHGSGAQCLNDNRVESNFDGLGRLVQVTQADESDGSDSSTSYLYNLQNKLIEVSQTSLLPSPQTQWRTFAYDGLGNLISESHPELAAPISYIGYDTAGNPILEEILGVDPYSGNPQPRQLEYSYKDPLRRLTQVHDGHLNRLLQANFYAKNNLGSDLRAGKLVQIQRHNYVAIGLNQNISDETAPKKVVVTQTYRYQDPEGRVSAVQTRATGTEHTPPMSFKYSLDYNALGVINHLSYPRIDSNLRGDQSLSLDYIYHAKNQTLLDQVVNPLATNPVTAMNHHASGLVASTTFGNGVTKTMILANNNMPRPHRIQTSGSNKNFDTNTFTYDCSGNITAIGSDSFIYDNVNRLTAASVRDLHNVTRNFSYGFDRFGNMTDHNGQAQSVDRASNQISLSSFLYDDFGNVLETPTSDYDYDPFNMAKTASFGSGLRTYIYGVDAQGRQLRMMTIKQAGTAEWTLRGSDSKVLRTYKKNVHGSIRPTTDHVYAQGLVGRLAYTPSGAVSRHAIVTDHLGSIRQRLDGNGDVVREYKYDPFGNDLTGSSSQDDDVQRFTEHEKDNDQQTYMLARYFNPTLARFNSIDAVLGKLDDPQSWNRYTYVKNNPIAFVDPDGNEDQGFVKKVLQESKPALTASFTLNTASFAAHRIGKADAKVARLEHKLALRQMKPIPKSAKKSFLGIFNYESSAAKRKILAYKDLRRLSKAKLSRAFQKRALAVLGGGVGTALTVADLAISAWKLNSEMGISAALNDEEGQQLAEMIELARKVELAIQEDEKTCECTIDRSAKTVDLYIKQVQDE